MRRKAPNFPFGKLATSWFSIVPVDGKFDASRKIRSTEFRHGGHWYKVLGKERLLYNVDFYMETFVLKFQFSVDKLFINVAIWLKKMYFFIFLILLKYFIYFEHLYFLADFEIIKYCANHIHNSYTLLLKCHFATSCLWHHALFIHIKIHKQFIEMGTLNRHNVIIYLFSVNER